jgi:hypothetical protein
MTCHVMYHRVMSCIVSLYIFCMYDVGICIMHICIQYNSASNVSIYDYYLLSLSSLSQLPNKVQVPALLIAFAVGGSIDFKYSDFCNLIGLTPFPSPEGPLKSTFTLYPSFCSVKVAFLVIVPLTQPGPGRRSKTRTIFFPLSSLKNSGDSRSGQFLTGRREMWSIASSSDCGTSLAHLSSSPRSSSSDLSSSEVDDADGGSDSSSEPFVALFF